MGNDNKDMDNKRASVAYLENDLVWRAMITQATVNAVKNDICEWLTKLNLNVSFEGFLDDLSNGVQLCLLLSSIEPEASKKYFQNARGGSFQARDNISRFIQWMDSHSLSRFESDDVALGKDGPNFNLREKIVSYSLLDVGRFAGSRGFSPLPQLIEFEMEIDRAEKTSESEAAPSLSNLEISDAVETTEPIPEQPEQVEAQANLENVPDAEPAPAAPVQDLAAPVAVASTKVAAVIVPEPEPEPEKKVLIVNIEPGMYLIGNKKVHIRVVGVHIMVRTGGGWQALVEWLAATFGKDSDVNIDDVFSPPPGSKAAKSEKNAVTVKDILSVDAVFSGEKFKKDAKVTGHAIRK
eukprot:c1025_g1_i1.p1 GENE.c1025_g1_i1~~c1025_g1_i1.p1  ORF type:complete len:352 (-),score=104.54 c1025_g1_i1:13-1068(-)